MPDQDLDKAPVTEDENFVNVDQDFSNYSNEVDRPLPMEEVEDYNIPEEYREKKEKPKEKKEEPAKVPSPSAPITPPARPASK